MLSLPIVRTAFPPDFSHPLFSPKSVGAPLHLLSQKRVLRRYVRDLFVFDAVGLGLFSLCTVAANSQLIPL